MNKEIEINEHNFNILKWKELELPLLTTVLCEPTFLWRGNKNLCVVWTPNVLICVFVTDNDQRIESS